MSDHQKLLAAIRAHEATAERAERLEARVAELEAKADALRIALRASRALNGEPYTEALEAALAEILGEAKSRRVFHPAFHAFVVIANRHGIDPSKLTES